MVIAKGMHTGKVYARGEDSADVMRKLNEEYESFEPARGRERYRDRNPIFPEPLELCEEE